MRPLREIAATRMLPVLLAITTLVAAQGTSGDESERISNEFVMLASVSASERSFANLIAVRMAAIGNALGPILEDACTEIYIEFAKPTDASYPRTGWAEYDPVRHVLTFRRHVVGSLGYGTAPWADSYWPYYQNENLAVLAPAIGIVDDALWLAHLQEAAHRKGISWPHPGCSSLDMAKRLGCEMLVAGAEESLRPTRAPRIFNANRMDMLWPESLRELRSQAWRRSDTAYRDVQKLGGLLLVRSLVAEFGVPRVLRYVAQTPFLIEDDNVRVSALHYQGQARQALAADAINR